MQSAANIISSLFWFKDDSQPSEDVNSHIIEQFVQNVEDFSSQYGSEISVSYTAINLRGPPSNFPDYGDYPQAFVMVRSHIFVNKRNIFMLSYKIYQNYIFKYIFPFICKSFRDFILIIYDRDLFDDLLNLFTINILVYFCFLYNRELMANGGMKPPQSRRIICLKIVQYQAKIL